MDNEVNNRTCDVIKDGRFVCCSLSSVSDDHCPVAKIGHRSQAVGDGKALYRLSENIIEAGRELCKEVI